MSNPVYIGDTNIEEVPGAKLTRRRGVSDKLTRPYEGNINDLAAFIAANPIYGSVGATTVTDYEYPWMTLIGLETTEDGPKAMVTLEFVGYLFQYGNIVGNLQTSGSWEPRSVKLMTDNTADGLWTVNYYSPIITYKYVTSGINDTPIYQGASRNPDTITILDVSPASGQAAGYVIQGNWVFEVFSVCTSFRFDQKGQNYDYAETWVVTIQQPASGGAPANGPVQLSISGTPSTPPIQ